MKKCLLFLVAVVVFASANTGVIAAESNFSTSQGWESLESKENSVVSQISETIVRFYENKDLGCGNDLGKTMDQAIHSFLQDKADTHQYVTKIYGTYKDNYKVSVTTLETTRTGNKGFFRFQVRTSFNYVGSPDVVSGDSTELTVVFDYDRGLIVDFYDPSNYYDMFVREPGLDSMFTERDLRPFTLNPDIEEKQRSLRNSIDETYDAEIYGASASPDDSRSLMRSGPLNFGNVVLYARNNFDQTPVSGDGSVPYYDFSQIPGNWDCTNFVSHALLAGGANVYDTGGSGISSTGWYFRNLSNRSSSWSSVNYLHSFLTTNTTPNTLGGSSSDYTTRPGYWNTGYVIQFINPNVGTWYHSCIITGKSYYEDRQYALCTGRASPYSRQDNKNDAEIYPGGAKRTIYVYNN